MRNKYVSSISRENVPYSYTRSRRHRRSIGLVCTLLVVIVSGIVSPWVSSRAASQEADTVAFDELLMAGQGDAAVQWLIQIAKERGGWGPAPGDVVVFDPAMLRITRASTTAIDLPPVGCETGDPKEPKNPDCGRDFQAQQNLVRFGRYTFDNSTTRDTFEARPLDDVLSVYIEEVGHSWQEYCYETGGRCAGERSIQTTWGAGKQRASGWEYQVKMYILSLDGTWLALSDAERAELTTAICDGYANPRYGHFPEYPAPPGWPNPQGWPTTAPTVEAFHMFCNGIVMPGLLWR